MQEQTKLKISIESEIDDSDFDKTIREFWINKLDNKKEDGEVFYCDDCGKKIAKIVMDFCKKHPEWYDGIYCRGCQSKHKKKQEEIKNGV